MKKIISLLLALTLSLFVSPLTFAAEEKYGENLCIGKDVYTDAVYNNDPANFAAAFAIDGNVNTRAITSDKSVSEDKRSGFENYILVDLGDTFEINRIIARTRRDTDQEWCRRDFAVYCANKSDLSDAVKLGEKKEAGEFGSDLNIKVNSIRARYIFVANSAVITRGVGIAEIEAYGNEITEGELPEYSDVEGEAINSGKLLGALGIMNGISSEEFGAVNLIKRAEAVKIMCAMACADEEDYKGCFSDVSADDEYSGYIQAALDYGIISKDTMFRPDDYITGYELIKMILCINGYYVRVSKDLMYPLNIMKVAKNLELFTGVKTDYASYINRSDASIMLYNALLESTLSYTGNAYKESDENFLKERFGYSLMQGIITSNGISRLDQPLDSVNTKSVTIAGKTYENMSVGIEKYLGETVYYLLNEEDIVTAIWPDNKKNNIVKIDTADITNADFNAIEVYKELRTKKYVMTGNPYVLMNDVAYGGAEKTDLLAENGHIILLDNNHDNVYEVIKIYKPIVGVISGISYDEKYFGVTLATGEHYDYDYDMISALSEKGKKTKIQNFMSGHLIYIYPSANGKILKIQKMPIVFSGTVEGFSEDYISIDGVEYEMTEYFKRLFPDVGISTTASFYVDIDGRIVYMTNTDKLKSSEFIAFVQNVYFDSNKNKDMIRLYDTNKQFRELKFAEKVTVNGKKMDLSDVEAMGRETFTGKLVKVAVKGDELICSIMTEDYEDGGVYKSDVNLKNAYRGASGFYSGHVLMLPFLDDTPVFTIPVDEDGSPQNLDYKDLYNVVDLSAKYHIRDAVDSDIPLAYGIDSETGEPAALVQKLLYSQKTKNFGAISKANSLDALVFEKYSVGIDDGEEFYIITGYDIRNGVKKKLSFKPEITKAINTYRIQNYTQYSAGIDSAKLPTPSTIYVAGGGERLLVAESLAALDDVFFCDITDLKKGDIIRYSKGNYDTFSELELVGENIDYSEADTGVKYSAGDLNNNIMSAFRLQYSLVDGVTDGRFKFMCSDGAYETLRLSNFKGMVFVIENGEINPYKMSSASVYLNKNDKAVIFSSGGYHQSIIIYK